MSESPKRFKRPFHSSHSISPPAIIVPMTLLADHESTRRDYPLVMSISSVGEDLTIGEFQPVIIHDAASKDSLEFSVMELITATQESTHRVGWENHSRSTDHINGINLLKNSYPELGINDIKMKLRNLIYRGNIKFLKESPVNYVGYPLEYVLRFENMLRRSKTQDLCFSKWLDLMAFNEVEHESLYTHSRHELSSMLSYLKRKLDISTPLTPLDIFIVANAYHAELYFYQTYDDVPMSSQLRKFKFVKKSVYNCPVEGKTRVKWIIIQDGTGKFYPIVSHIESTSFYGYRFEKWSTKIIDTAIPRTAPLDL